MAFKYMISGYISDVSFAWVEGDLPSLVLITFDQSIDPDLHTKALIALDQLMLVV
jgi:hypothetical protein